MAVDVNTQEGIRYIRLTGALDITQAVDLKAALLESIASSPRIHIQVGGVSAVDVTTVQLLWAAVSHAKTFGIDLTMEGPVNEAVARSLAATGILPLMTGLLARSEEEAGNVLSSRS